MKTNGEHSEYISTASGSFFEVLTAEELAERWRFPVSWIREQTRSRCRTDFPHVRLGRYVRFCLNAELADWWARHQSGYQSALDCRSNPDHQGRNNNKEKKTMTPARKTSTELICKQVNRTDSAEELRDLFTQIPPECAVQH